jgi:hypothetical protein
VISFFDLASQIAHVPNLNKSIILTLRERKRATVDSFPLCHVIATIGSCCSKNIGPFYPKKNERRILCRFLCHLTVWRLRVVGRFRGCIRLFRFVQIIHCIWPCLLSDIKLCCGGIIWLSNFPSHYTNQLFVRVHPVQVLSMWFYICWICSSWWRL